MDQQLINTIAKFQMKKILVIGDAMLDTYFKGTSSRICREAPVPIVAIDNKEYAGGGAANTAVSVAALGATTNFISVVGDDSEGRQLLEVLKKRNVKSSYIIVDKMQTTIAKQRIVASDQLLVRYDAGAIHLSPQIEQQIINYLEELYPLSDAVIVSDYNYGILTSKIIEAIARLQESYKKILAVDSKRLEEMSVLSPTLVKPNYGEAVNLLDLPKETDDKKRLNQILKQGKRLQKKLNTAIAAITLDTLGALVFADDLAPYRTYANPQDNSHAAGAGDTYISTFALALASKASVHVASELACQATGIVVQKPGTTICSREDLIMSYDNQTKILPSRKALRELAQKLRKENKRIVFTNGCFDILHRGHVSYLREAKKHGDVLILGINSDESVQRLKGPTRPINTLSDRMAVLEGLESIDYLISFKENTPINLIKILQPDIYVKGGDYTRESLPETPIVEAYGGKVELIPFVMDRSTTKIIKKIKNEDKQTQPKKEAFVQIQ